MGRRYEQLSLEERCTIARLQAEGRSVRQIAAALDRTPSTISREVRRNRGREVGYKPGYAQDQAKARRWMGCRLDREPELRGAVLERLAQGVVARTGRRPACPRGGPQGDQLREHLPLHLCPDRPHQELRLAPLSAARQEQARLSRTARRQHRKADRRPYFRGRTAVGRCRPHASRPLGSRHDPVCQIRSGRARHSRTANTDYSGDQTTRSNRRARGAPPHPVAHADAAATASDRYVRQRQRVRRPWQTAQARHRYLLL